MLTRPRTRSPGLPVLVAGASRRRRRRWPWALLAGGLLVAAALGALHFAWPHGSISVEAEGLPQVHRPRLAGSLERVTVRTADGTAVPVAVQPDGTLRPRRAIAPGTRLVAVAVFRRPGWIGWIAGHTQTTEIELVAPTAQPTARWLRVQAGKPVRVRFDRPVREVQVRGVEPWRLIRLPRPRRMVTLGRFGRAGSIGVGAVAETWEKLPRPTTVTWFPPGKKPMLLAWPAAGTQLSLGMPLRLRFSQPVAKVLHGSLPVLSPAVHGRWRTVDSHTLEFAPGTRGFGLDGHVRVTLPVAVERIGSGARPTKTISWATPAGSELRLEELLALLRYLPLRWTARTADAARTPAAQIAAAVDPPVGTFTWRYPGTPPELRRLWQPNRYNAIVRGAVMAFQNEHGLTVDGFAGHDVWQALIADVIAGKPRETEYSYVFVHSTVPQSLNLWNAGKVILTSPGNTGVPAAPTELGTFPVFEHIPVGTMSGTNPDGSHYNDPGIRWISYFNHGEAIHAFNRASFGTPQSLGCVELPLAAAAKVWPYTPIGTLVTVES
jgi:lipoprotein-anchoring transpeptidase ErfK/SrfK